MTKEQLLFAYGPRIPVILLNFDPNKMTQNWNEVMVNGRVEAVLTRTVGQEQTAHEVFDFNVRSDDGIEYRYTYDPTVDAEIRLFPRNCTGNAKYTLTRLFEAWEAMINNFIDSKRKAIEVL